jgi:hypothetical protein
VDLDVKMNGNFIATLHSRFLQTHELEGGATASELAVGAAASERQRREPCQPRATPWVAGIKTIKALKGRHHDGTALQGFDPVKPRSQGVALGWYVAGPLALKTVGIQVPCRLHYFNEQS